MAGKIVTEDEIDIRLLVNQVWAKRQLIYKTTGIFIVLGLIIAFTSKVEYVAYSKLIPEMQEVVGSDLSDLGGLSSLAGLAGIDIGGLGNSGGSLSPDLYPELAKSTPFLIGLIEKPIYFEKLDTTISSFVYLSEFDNESFFELVGGYTIGLPFKIKEWISKDKEVKPNSFGMMRYSKKDWEYVEEFTERLSVSVDKQTGIITAECEMPDPVASALITSELVNGLTNNVSDYILEKVRLNLLFVQEQFDEAETDYKLKQERLARFVDSNRNITSSVFQAEYERLNNELDIAFEVYKGLATQLEQVKIRVEEKKPVFTILEPVRIPEDKNWPRRGIILIISAFLGGILGIGIVLIRLRQ